MLSPEVFCINLWLNKYSHKWRKSRNHAFHFKRGGFIRFIGLISQLMQNIQHFSQLRIGRLRLKLMNPFDKLGDYGFCFGFCLCFGFGFRL